MKKNKTLFALHISFVFCFISSLSQAKTQTALDKKIDNEFKVDSVSGAVSLSAQDRDETAVQKPKISKLGNERPLRVWLDPGHGGKDLGAQGLNGASEKDICLRASRMIRREIEKYAKLNGVPFEVRLSRDSDDFISLKERAYEANTWGADLFVSIHANSSPAPKAKGFEVYFLSPEATDAEASKLARLENQAPPTPVSAQVISILSDATTQYHVAESSRLAESMFSAMSQKIGSNSRAVRQAPFTVLHGTNMPAVLVEIGYVTHWEDSKNLVKDSYLKRVASAISDGIVEFATQKRK